MALRLLWAAGHANGIVPHHIDRQFAVTQSNLIWQTASAKGRTGFPGSTTTTNSGVYYSIVLTLSSMSLVCLKYMLDARDLLSMLSS